MIIDRLENNSIYCAINKRFSQAFKYIYDTDLSLLTPGIYTICGDEIFVIVSEYETKSLSEGLWEAHKEYIDIQYIIKGNEKIGCCNIKNLVVEKQYDAEFDVVLGQASGNLISLNEGEFMVLFPEDVHKPGIVNNKIEQVKKVVIKVRE